MLVSKQSTTAKMVFTLIPLVDSNICRLCCNDSTLGIGLFDETNNERLYDSINTYLPLQVQNDNKLPRRICRDCHTQLVNTVNFLNKIVNGQHKLREMWQKELILRQSLNSSSFLHLKNDEVDPLEVSASSFYATSSKIANKIDGSCRGRGRPRKNTNTLIGCSSYNGLADSGRERPAKRRRKAPERFSELLSGKAIDQALLTEGVINISEAEATDAPVIGHLKSKDGSKNEPILSHVSRQFVRRKKDERKDSVGAIITPLQSSPADVNRGNYDLNDQSTSEKSLNIENLSSNETDGAQFGEDESLQYHLPVHNNNLSKKSVNLQENRQNQNCKYKCEQCHRKFLHAPSLAYHMTVAHNDKDFFQCSSCDKTFRHKQLLLRHQFVHTNERPYSCNVCFLKFKSHSNLLNHVLIHSGNKFQCDICQLSFRLKSTLAQHLLIHQGIKAFKCDYCEKAFLTKSNMKEHIRIHTGEKPYQCHICHRRFTTSSQVSYHKKSHSDHRPWQCSYCPRAFLYKDIWKTHERRHRGEKPFVCSYCQRGFTESWSLKKHIRLHTGEKPYRCNVCDKAFADCSNLKKHKKVHINISSSNTEDMIYMINQQDAETSQPLLQSMRQMVDLPNYDIPKLLDDDGNPLTVFLPNGISVVLLSIDADDVLHTRTSEGLYVQIQLPSGANIYDEPILEQIRETVKSLYKNVDNEVKEDNITFLVDDDQLASTLSDLNTTIDSSTGSSHIMVDETNCY